MLIPWSNVVAYKTESYLKLEILPAIPQRNCRCYNLKSYEYENITCKLSR